MNANDPRPGSFEDKAARYPGFTLTDQPAELGPVHKAEPGRDLLHCGTCGQRIRQVPGGQGSTWVHADSGAVAAPNPPLTDAEVKEVTSQLMTDVGRYMAVSGTYADGYLDALLDVLAGLGLLQVPAAYEALRQQIRQQKAP